MAVLLAAAAGFAALAVSMSERGDAAFPGANGKVAYSYGDGYSRAIWAANSDGSAPTMLTNGSSDYAPAYSPNGARIAFERENGVAAMNADGSGVTQLLSGSFSQSSKTEWQENYETPKGEHIPFVKIQTNSSSWHSFSGPAFSPDGSQLAVVKGIEDGFFRVTCAVGEAEGQVCLDYNEPGAYFNYDFECTECFSQIVTVSSGNGAMTGQITPATKETYFSSPVYSADGKVAFGRSSESLPGSHIFVVSSPGAAPVQVTNGFSDREPDFSPDSSRIVFSHNGEEVGLVGAGGGPVTILPVPNPSKGFNSVVSPSFSPDGSRIVFERAIYPNGNPESGLYTMATDGSGLTRILAGSEPSWQPVPPPPPPPPATRPKSKAGKSKVKLDKKNKAAIGTIACGSSACELKVLSALLKAGKKKCGVKAKVAKKLAPGKVAGVGVKVTGKCLAALKKAGKGQLVVKVQVTDALGKSVLTLKTILIATRTGHGRGGK